jgi:hypothetical protein
MVRNNRATFRGIITTNKSTATSVFRTLYDDRHSNQVTRVLFTIPLVNELLTCDQLHHLRATTPLEWLQLPTNGDDVPDLNAIVRNHADYQQMVYDIIYICHCYYCTRK